MRAVPKPRSDPSLNQLHDSGVAVDQAGVFNGAGVTRSGSAISVGSRRLRKRRELNSKKRTGGAGDRAFSQTSARSAGATALLLGSSTSSSLSSLTDCSDTGKRRAVLPTVSELISTCCLDFRWLASISLACLAICLCAGLFGLQAAMSGRLTALTAKCVTAGHQVFGLTEDMQRLHSQLATCRINATAQAEAAERLQLAVLSLQQRVAELYAARRRLAQVGPLRDKVQKLVQDSADRGAAIARLESRQRIMGAALAAKGKTAK